MYITCNCCPINKNNVAENSNDKTDRTAATEEISSAAVEIVKHIALIQEREEINRETRGDFSLFSFVTMDFWIFRRLLYHQQTRYVRCPYRNILLTIHIKAHVCMCMRDRVPVLIY